MVQEIIRRNELIRVASGLAQGQWFIIYAAPASGKTTFLSQLAGYLQSDYRVKYISMRACTTLSIGEVLSLLADAISPGARAETSLELRSLLLGTRGRLAILLDDVGCLQSEVAGPLLNNFAAWRSESRLNPKLRNISLVLSASRDLLALGQGVQSCLNTLEEFFLPDFSRTEVVLQAGVQGEKIWQLAEGHPWLTNYLHPEDRSNVWLEAVAGKSLCCLDNVLFNLTYSRLKPELLQGYEAGRWTGTAMSRQLRLLGLAKWSKGELRVRNRLFEWLLELYLANEAQGSANQKDSTVYPREVLAPAYQSNTASGRGLGEEQVDYETREAANWEKLFLYADSKEIRLKGVAVVLTAVEYRILEHLILHGGRIISKDSLAAAAYPGEPVPLTDVESHIKNIRRKLGDNAKNPRFIRCRRGFGYQVIENAYGIG